MFPCPKCRAGWLTAYPGSWNKPVSSNGMQDEEDEFEEEEEEENEEHEDEMEHDTVLVSRFPVGWRHKGKGLRLPLGFSCAIVEGTVLRVVPISRVHEKYRDRIEDVVRYRTT